jgi:hypothetical protein
VNALDGQTTRGKWAQPGVPHRGWTCIGVEDLEAPVATCEMCETVIIRYVHRMMHADYPTSLGVGCICAGHMEGDYVAPRAREVRLRTRARRRQTWGRRQWSRSRHGNLYLRTEGYVLTIVPQGMAWRVLVQTQRSTRLRQLGRLDYATPQEAKAAALDALLWAKARMG